MAFCPYCKSGNVHLLGAELVCDELEVYLAEEYWCNHCEWAFIEETDWPLDELDDDTKPTDAVNDTD